MKCIKSIRFIYIALINCTRFMGRFSGHSLYAVPFGWCFTQVRVCDTPVILHVYFISDEMQISPCQWWEMSAVLANTLMTSPLSLCALLVLSTVFTRAHLHSQNFGELFLSSLETTKTCTAVTSWTFIYSSISYWCEKTKQIDLCVFSPFWSQLQNQQNELVWKTLSYIFTQYEM